MPLNKETKPNTNMHMFFHEQAVYRRGTKIKKVYLMILGSKVVKKKFALLFDDRRWCFYCWKNRSKRGLRIGFWTVMWQTMRTIKTIKQILKEILLIVYFWTVEKTRNIILYTLSLGQVSILEDCVTGYVNIITLEFLSKHTFLKFCSYLSIYLILFLSIYLSDSIIYLSIYHILSIYLSIIIIISL